MSKKKNKTSYKSIFANNKFFYPFIILVSGIIIGGLVTSMVFIIETSDQYHHKSEDIITSNVTNQNWKQFSQNNSFRISLQSGPEVVEAPSGESTIKITQGTAWSWYINNNSSQFCDWYLLTNYHVVEPALTYLQADKNNPVTKLNNHFRLKLDRFVVNEQANEGSYSTILYTVDYLQQRDPNFISAEIISDNQIDNFDLFSNNRDLFNNYNLDMALVKIRLKSWPTNLGAQNRFDWNKVANPYMNYLNELNQPKPMLEAVDDNQQNNLWEPIYYMAGNPGEYKQLVYSQTAMDLFSLTKTVYDVSPTVEKINQPIYKYNSRNPMTDWVLTNGASGSAVYEVKAQEQDLFYSYPFGIYWGGFGDHKSFWPSFVPLITKHYHGIDYNVYENFKVLFELGVI